MLNLPGLDPLFIGDVAVNRGFEVNHFGMQASGVSDFKIEKMRVNLDNFKVDFLFHNDDQTIKETFFVSID